MSSSPVEFSSRLQNLLDLQRITPYRLSKISGVNQSIISRCLKNNAIPNTKNRIKLAVALGVTEDYLYTGHNEGEGIYNIITDHFTLHRYVHKCVLSGPRSNFDIIPLLDLTQIEDLFSEDWYKDWENKYDCYPARNYNQDVDLAVRIGNKRNSTIYICKHCNLSTSMDLSSKKSGYLLLTRSGMDCGSINIDSKNNAFTFVTADDNKKIPLHDVGDFRVCEIKSTVIEEVF